MDLEKIKNILNEAYEADPTAIQAMLCYLVPINQELADHPTIQCREFGKGYALSFLGLLNGLVGDTEEMICTVWSDEADENGKKEFMGFDTVKPVFREEE